MFPRIQFSDFLKKARVGYSQLSGRLGKVTWARRGASWSSGLPVLAAGEYFLTDEHGAYLTDENGNYLIGKDS